MTYSSDRKNTRKVRFNEERQIIEVDIVENDERDSVWYSPRDLQTLRRSQQEQDDLPSNDCSTLFHTFVDAKRQKEFVTMLLLHQLEHQKMGLTDPKGLFQVSKALSKRSKELALKAAQAHEKEVQKDNLSLNQKTMAIIDDALELLEAF